MRKNLKKLLRERKKCVIIPSEEYLNAKMRSAVRQSAFRREGHHRLGVTRTQSCMHFPAEQTRSKTASSRVRSATVIQPRVRAPFYRARIKVVTRRILLLRPFSGWGSFFCSVLHLPPRRQDRTAENRSGVRVRCINQTKFSSVFGAGKDCGNERKTQTDSRVRHGSAQRG